MIIKYQWFLKIIQATWNEFFNVFARILNYNLPIWCEVDFIACTIEPQLFSPHIRRDKNI